jgi:hypothetical protein
MKLNPKWIVVAVIVMAFVGNFIRYSHRAPRRHYADFRVYHATAERFLQKQDIYDRPDMAITPFKYSPMFAFLVSPLGFVNRHTASLIFFTINFATLISLCFLIPRLLGITGLTVIQRIFLYFIPILFTSRFILQVWDSGQVNLIMFLLTVASLYFMRKGKDALAGGALGLSVMFKYMPAVFVPYLIFQKKYKMVTWILVSIVIWCFLPALVVGWETQMFYLQKWLPSISETSLDHSSWYDYKNQSLYSTVLRYLTKDATYGLKLMNLTFEQGLGLSILLGGLIYVLVLFKGRNVEEQFKLDWSILFLCMALFNPNAWMMNFVVFFFVYMYLMDYLFRVRWQDKVTLGLMLLAFIVSSWTSESLVGNDLENRCEELSFVTLGALILIVSLLRLKFGHQYQQIRNVSA